MDEAKMENLISNSKKSHPKTIRHSYLKKYEPGTKRERIPLGEDLYCIVRSKNDSGSKSYVGKMRHPITRKWTEKTAGRVMGSEGISPEEAKTAWLAIKTNAKKNKCHPGKVQGTQKVKTLNEVKDELFIVLKTKIKPNTLREYQRQFRFNILPNLDGDAPISTYETDAGADIIDDALVKIRGGLEGTKYELERKCRGLLHRTFKYAQAKRWIKLNPVNTNRDMLPTHRPIHHPKLEWDEVPGFIDKIETFGWNYPPQQVLCTKLILLTGLRAGAAVRLKWRWIDLEKKLITIPGSTSGLKRVKGKNDHKPHFIPITKHIEKLLLHTQKWRLSEEYVFAPITHSRYPHLDPEAPNNFIRALGIKNKDGRPVVVHGWRGTFNTEGINIIKAELDVIKKQMGHLPEGKVNQAYDHSQRLPERKQFLTQWGKELINIGLTL